MSDSAEERSIRELKLTAVAYATKRWVVDYVRETGEMPEEIPFPGYPTAARALMRMRGVDPELTEKEQLVLDAMLRSRRLPGPSTVLIDEELRRQGKSEEE